VSLADIEAAASVLELAAIEHTEARQRGNEQHVELTRQRLEAARALLTEAARAATAMPAGFKADMLAAADFVGRRREVRAAPVPTGGKPRQTRLAKLEAALREYARR
jgi:hypothetical protein